MDDASANSLEIPDTLIQDVELEIEIGRKNGSFHQRSIGQHFSLITIVSWSIIRHPPTTTTMMMKNK